MTVLEVTVRGVSELLIVSAWLPSVAVLVLFWRVPWWRSAIGRAQFVLALGMAAVLSLVAMRLLLPDAADPWLDVARLFVYPLIVVGMTLQWLAFRSTLARAPDPADDKEPAP